MREWQKLKPAEKMWGKWKKKLFLAYAAKELSNKARHAVGQPFGGQYIAQALTQQVQPQVTNQMVDTLFGYLDKITVAATTTGRGTDMADLDARMAILVDTNTE